VRFCFLVFFQAEDGIRDRNVTGVQTCALPISSEYKGVQVDPLSLVRRIWSHLQSQPDGDLGLKVDSTTSPVRIGTKSEDVEFTRSEERRVGKGGRYGGERK